MQSVIIYEPKGWYTVFLVDNIHIVDTVDIYTYQCQSCDSFECQHVNSVNEYVLQNMDLFCQALDVKNSIFTQIPKQVYIPDHNIVF